MQIHAICRNGCRSFQSSARLGLQFNSFVNCKMAGDEFMKIRFNRLLRGDSKPVSVRKRTARCLIIIRPDYTIRANNHRCMYVRVYVRQVFDGNPMPCRKKRVNDYRAAPEAAQWNDSMDEPPVASLANQPPAQGTFDNLRYCIRCIGNTRFILIIDSSANSGCVFS